jgi:hypothetical protein
MKQWKKNSDFALAVCFSFVYFIVALFTLLGTAHPPSELYPTSQATALTSHPFYSFFYLLIALLISWGLYFYFHDKPGKVPFFISLLVGLGLIISGVMVWVSTIGA